MAKRIVNKAERNAERYNAKETGCRLFEDSQKNTGSWKKYNSIS